MKYLIPLSSQTATAEISMHGNVRWQRIPARAKLKAVLSSEWLTSAFLEGQTEGKQMGSERTLSAHAGSTARTAGIILMCMVLWSLTAGQIFGASDLKDRRRGSKWGANELCQPTPAPRRARPESS